MDAACLNGRLLYCDMLRVACAVVLCLLIAPAAVDAQRRRQPASKPKPPAAKPARVTEPAKFVCREQLGTGLKTRASYCFVLAGRQPSEGVVITIPRHSGATLTFDLHNRHTYSEEEVKAGRGFARYTAVVAVLTMAGDVLGRGAVQTEFRTAADFYERIGGGAGPGGAKAVAPVGREAIRVEIPAAVTEVSLLGELLDATTSSGRETASPGRPVAIVSNVRVEYVARK